MKTLATSRCERLCALRTSRIQVEVKPGSFDMRGFEITRSELLNAVNRPSVTLGNNRIKFSTICVRKFARSRFIEILVHPLEKKLAIRSVDEKSRNRVVFSKNEDGIIYPKEISATAYLRTLYQLFNWNISHKYRMTGALYEQGAESAYIFDADEPETFIKSLAIDGRRPPADSIVDIRPLAVSGKHIRAIPEKWANSFGTPFYLHERSLSELESQSEQDWKIQLEGKLYDTGMPLKVTPFQELRSFIRQELASTSKERTV